MSLQNDWVYYGILLVAAVIISVGVYCLAQMARVFDEINDKRGGHGEE